MRDLKFRQRNLNNGLYYYWGLVDGIWQNPKIQDNYIHPMDSEQYTGLKDKNGVEIYEDNIVKFNSYLHRLDQIGVIKWDKCGYNIENGNEQFMVTISIIRMLFFDSETQLEVIGNVHDNPELLEPHT